MATFPRLKSQSGSVSRGESSDATNGHEPMKTERKPRVILTEGAILPTEHVEKSATEKSDAEGAHHICSIGDVVMMTDAEFAAHQAGGVCIVDYDQREAA